MKFLTKKIFVDTLKNSGETFDLNGVVSFTVHNIGNTTALLSYKGESTLMEIAPHTAREFPGDSGYNYTDIMQIKFKEHNTGFIEVIKSRTTTNEF